jgi:exodeoxyribonuclease V beta subunit
LPLDAVVGLLADGPADEVARRAERLTTAFADFDRATIMTTHEFCHNMLAGLGVLAPQTPLSTLVEDLGPLADEAARTCTSACSPDEPHGAPFPYGKPLGRRPRRAGDRPPGRQRGRRTGRLGLPGPVGDRVAFAESVRHEVERRKAARGCSPSTTSCGGWTTRCPTPTGAQARARLAARFPVVLVDEFQDTDPTQWSILRQAFSRVPARWC